jgi:hypothetical protein
MFNDTDLANNIQKNTLRYIRYFEDEADQLLPAPTLHIEEHDVRDTLEVIESAASSSYPF